MKEPKKLNGIYHLEFIAEIIETCILTSFIENEVPVSVILVGPSGSAKSKLIKSYGDDFIHQTDSFSSYGLFTLAQLDHKNEKKFIVVPDFNATLSRKTSTVHSAVASLLSLTYDGQVRVDDGRESKECKHAPMGFITACTPEVYDKHAKQWFALGLRRRIIPIFYRFSTATENDLQARVGAEQIHSEMLGGRIIDVPKFPFAQIPKSMHFDTERLSNKFAENLGKLSYFAKGIKRWEVRDVVPISPHITLRTLIKAHSGWRGDRKVTDADLKFVASFIDFTNPESPKEI